MFIEKVTNSTIKNFSKKLGAKPKVVGFTYDDFMLIELTSEKTKKIKKYYLDDTSCLNENLTKNNKLSRAWQKELLIQFGEKYIDFIKKSNKKELSK